MGKEKDLSQTKAREMLAEVGREIATDMLKGATDMLKGAVESAQNKDMMVNQIFALRRASLFILATEWYNIIANSEHTTEQYLEALIRDLKSEFKFLSNTNEGEMEIHNYGDDDET